MVRTLVQEAITVPANSAAVRGRNSTEMPSTPTR